MNVGYEVCQCSSLFLLCNTVLFYYFILIIFCSYLCFLIEDSTHTHFLIISEVITSKLNCGFWDISSVVSVWFPRILEETAFSNVSFGRWYQYRANSFKNARARILLQFPDIFCPGNNLRILFTSFPYKSQNKNLPLWSQSLIRLTY